MHFQSILQQLQGHSNRRFRSNPQPANTPQPTATYRPFSSDEYDVEYYSDPEEFYYWHMDDFYDYEEAEEYYYSHGGK